MIKNVKIDLDEVIDRIAAKSGERPSEGDIAEKLDISSRKTLYNWKTGKGLHILAKTKKLAEIAGMTMDELVKYSEDE